MEINNDDPKSMQLLLQSRASELFKMCDTEDKGFINRKDIQRMREPLGLAPELLEEVFDSLDYDRNGFLTLDEFTAGFSSYLGMGMDSSEQHLAQNNINGQHVEEEEALFRETMESLGASNVIDGYKQANLFFDFYRLGFVSVCLKSELNLRELWSRLRNEDPSMQRIFESFIANVSLEIRKSKTDFTILESALQK